MKEWSDFFIAVAGAAAALAGLLFVGVSINLAKILSIPKLPNRALISLVLLLTVLVTALLFLVPGQALQLIGVEISILGVLIWFFIFYIDIGIIRGTEKKYKRVYLYNVVFDQIATLPYIICGIALLICGEAGLYWIVPAVIFSIIKAILDAWVLLVEIQR